MAKSEIDSCFVIDKTGNSCSKEDLTDKDSEIEIKISNPTGHVQKTKRKKTCNNLEKLVFGEDISDKLNHILESDNENKGTKKSKKPAWRDEDDEILADKAFEKAIKYPKKVVPKQKYRAYLVEKFSSIYEKPKWVTNAESNVSTEDDDSDLLGYVGELKKEGLRLESHDLRFSKCANLTLQQPLAGVLPSVQFHPSSNLALVAAANGTLCVFQVDGDKNANLQNLHFENFSIDRARFVKGGKEIIVGSRPAIGYFYVFDLMKGQSIRVPLKRAKENLALRRFVISNDEKTMASKDKNGDIYLYTMDSFETVMTFKLNEKANGLFFTKDDQKLFSHSDEGVVYVYDIRHSKRCYHRFVDEGSLGGRSLVISPNQGHLVTGDQSGQVNIYNFESIWNSENPKPSKKLCNLKTPIECLKFNYTSELMAMSSGFIDNAVRTVQFPSTTVFSNFPRPYTEYKRITEVDISPNSGYLTMANNRGTAFLFNLNHYIHY